MLIVLEQERVNQRVALCQSLMASNPQSDKYKYENQQQGVARFRPGLAYSIAFVASIRDESVSKKSRRLAAFTILDRCPDFDLEDDMDEMHRIQAVRESPA